MTAGQLRGSLVLVSLQDLMTEDIGSAPMSVDSRETFLLSFHLAARIPSSLMISGLRYRTSSRLVKKLSAKMAVVVGEDMVLARTETIWLLAPMDCCSGVRGQLVFTVGPQRSLPLVAGCLPFVCNPHLIHRLLGGLRLTPEGRIEEAEQWPDFEEAVNGARELSVSEVLQLLSAGLRLQTVLDLQLRLTLFRLQQISALLPCYWMNIEQLSSFESPTSTLDSIHSTVTDRQRIHSLEANATEVDQRLQQLEDACSALKGDNETLKTKVADLEGRSRHQNLRIIGLPESIEAPRPSAFFSQLLVDTLGTKILASPPSLTELTGASRPSLPQEGDRDLSPMAELYKRGYKPALLFPAKLRITLPNGDRTWLMSAP
ncbi:hypothetical protein F7725_014814 [Dissostichus mawsoni]|uniref:Uncharacterized protein n=1 Tax=Dissostichus mawsoni TaxID=36200 RepID=A0A7J5YXH0_DISMA|nr:hypothetical protein F7725_014814 [Dissostichus mawsoni]